MSWSQMTAPAPTASFEVPPADNHGAVLVAVIDLGTHSESYKGEAPKDTHKVYLVWELTSCQMAGTTNNMLIGHQYTFSLHEKAGLRRMIHAWRGRDLAVGEAFDILKLLGQKCLVNVSHKQTGDKVFASVGSITKVPPGMAVNPAKRTPVARHVLAAEPVPDWLPFLYGEKVEEVVKRAKEVRPAQAAPAAAPHQQPQGHYQPTAAVGAAAGREDEIPF